MNFQYEDKVNVIGLPDCSEGIGTVIDWFISIKGQSIKVEFDQPCIVGNIRWINVYDPSLTIIILELVEA